MPHRERFQALGELTVEAVRSAALGAAPDGVRTFVIGEAEREAVHTALDGDGLAIAAAPDAATLVERATGVAPPAGAGPIALARLARAALADGTARVLLLENAGAASAVTARFWWTLAVMQSEDDAPDGVLLAVCGAKANDAWSASTASVRGLVPVRELVVPAPPRIPSRSRAKLAAAAPVRARRALLRATAALLRGTPSTIESAAQVAADASAAGDDAREAAAAALALALRGFPSDRSQPFRRATALARLAGDDVLDAAASTAARLAALLRGDFAAARALAGPVTGLPRSVRRALDDLGIETKDRVDGLRLAKPVLSQVEGLAQPERLNAATFAARAESHERAGRRAVAARLYACAAAALGQPFRGATWDRARRLWEVTDPRLAAAVSAAAAPGLGGTSLPAGAAGIAEAIRASASFVSAGSAAPGAALELACQLVPCRAATLTTASGSTLAARGAAALSLGRLHADGDGRGSAPQELASGGTLRVLFARAADDPPFSRDERRLAAAIAELAAAVLQPGSPTAASASTITADERAPALGFRRKRRGAALPPLDDRLSEVERDVLIQALRRTGGNLSRTARTLGLSRNGLKMKLARHGLPRGTRA